MKVNVYESRAAMGGAAAAAIVEKIAELLEAKPVINMVFAAAPSQDEVLAGLLDGKVEWNRVNAFHMDEYIGLERAAPQGFGNFLKERLFSKAGFREVFYMNGAAADAVQECGRYARLLDLYPTDIVVLGIGENTHLAFNDPHVARFDDVEMVKPVKLDKSSRQQQVNDGCFATIGEVPEQAMTLTIPALFKAEYAYVIVPGKRKADAVERTLYAEISERYPSTILRRHPHAVLFLDEDSAMGLGQDSRTASDSR